MTISGFSKYWTLLIILLVAAITVGGIVAWSRYSGSQPIEISASKPPVRSNQTRFISVVLSITPASTP